MANKQNIRTRQAIISAFIKIIDHKPFERIVIQDILDEAPVSRSTFYTYFHDKYEIAEYLENEVLNALENLGYAFVFFDHAEIGEAPAYIFETSRQYRPYVSALLKIRTDKVDLIGKISRNIHKNYILSNRNAERQFEQVEAQMFADIYARFIVYTLTEDVPPEDLMKQFRAMYMNVFMRLLSLNEDSEAKIRRQIDAAVIRDHRIFLEREKQNGNVPSDD